MRPREWRTWSLWGSPKREDHFCFPRESCIAENRTQLKGEDTKEVIPPTPYTIQSFACGAPPFKPLRIAFPLGFLLSALLGLQVHCQLSLEGDKGMNGGREEKERESEPEGERVQTLPRQRPPAGSCIFWNIQSWFFFSSTRKMYVLKFPLMETQRKISQSLNVLTIQDLDYSTLRMFLKFLNYSLLLNSWNAAVLSNLQKHSLCLRNILSLCL